MSEHLTHAYPAGLWAYKLAGGNSFALDVILDDSHPPDVSKMALWIPVADGARRDGVGDLLEVGGINCERHRKNPIGLFDHGKQVQIPLGLFEDPQTKAYTFTIDQVAKTAGGFCFFYQGKGLSGVEKSEDYQHAVFCEQIFDMAVKRFIRGGSIGYQVLAARELQPDYERGTPKGLHLLSTLMLEGSLVVLPANMDTVQKMLSMPECCGKPLSPVLVKSLQPYAVERPAQLGWEPREPKTESKAIPPARWKPGVGAIKTFEDRLKSMYTRKDLRKKYKKSLDVSSKAFQIWQRDGKWFITNLLTNESQGPFLSRLEAERDGCARGMVDCTDRGVKIKSLRAKYKAAENWNYWLDLAMAVLGDRRTWAVIARLPGLINSLRQLYQRGLTPDESAEIIKRLYDMYKDSDVGKNAARGAIRGAIQGALSGKSLNAEIKEYGDVLFGKSLWPSDIIDEAVLGKPSQSSSRPSGAVEWGVFLAAVTAALGVSHLSMMAIRKLRELFARRVNPTVAAAALKNTKHLVLEAKTLPRYKCQATHKPGPCADPENQQENKPGFVRRAVGQYASDLRDTVGAVSGVAKLAVASPYLIAREVRRRATETPEQRATRLRELEDDEKRLGEKCQATNKPGPCADPSNQNQGVVGRAVSGIRRAAPYVAGAAVAAGGAYLAHKIRQEREGFRRQAEQFVGDRQPASKLRQEIEADRAKPKPKPAHDTPEAMARRSAEIRERLQRSSDKDMASDYAHVAGRIEGSKIGGEAAGPIGSSVGGTVGAAVADHYSKPPKPTKPKQPAKNIQRSDKSLTIDTKGAGFRWVLQVQDVDGSQRKVSLYASDLSDATRAALTDPDVEKVIKVLQVARIGAKALSATRQKYRITSKGFVRRLKHSSDGTAIVHVNEKDMKAVQTLAESRGLKFTSMGGGRIKLIGSDAAADEVAKQFGRPLR